MALQVPLYQPHDFELTSDTPHDNPFFVELKATFESASGTRIESIPGFYDGDGKWLVRFSANRPGEWKGRTQSDDPALDGVELGPLKCVANKNARVHGRVLIDRQDPQKLAWEDGTPLLALGFECDWLFSYHQKSPDLCHRHVDLINERGFNYIVTNIYAHTGFSTPEARGEGPILPGTVYGPPELYVFGGTNEEPDHTHLNTEFFQDYDRMMRLLHERGIVAHIMIQVQNKHVHWPSRLSREDDLFWGYVVSRYQAFGNIVWDISKESYNFYKETKRHDYSLNRIQFIRNNDSYRHLVTSHDPEVRSESSHCIVDEACDFVADQIHLQEAGRYNREAITCLRRLPHKPYMNIEYGYELGAEELKTYLSWTSKPWQDILDWTWALYLAGAYPCYYYNNTSWDLIKFEPEPEGWKRYQYMMDFLGSVSFNRMRAWNELVEDGFCLADPGREYLVYLPKGGETLLDLSACYPTYESRLNEEQAATGAVCEWMNTHTGERIQNEASAKWFWSQLHNPFEHKEQPVAVIVRRK